MSSVLTSSSFSTSPSNVWIDYTEQTSVPNASDPVALTLSDGSSVVVFDSKTTALKCLEFMRTAGQWAVLPKSNVLVVAVSFHKLLVCEMTVELQKLFQAFFPVYNGGVVQFAHRSLYTMMSLSSALATVGSLVPGTLTDNASLAAAKLPMLIVDWNFQANAPAGSGSKLVDPSPLQYDYAP
jgi:hypothetical protein